MDQAGDPALTQLEHASKYFHELTKVTAARRVALESQGRCRYELEMPNIRGTVYEEASVIAANAQDVDAAVAAMMHKARENRTGKWPALGFGFDQEGVRHLRARAWQFCAQYLDPEQPDIEPFWD
jgi:hypothetical protein